MQVMPHAGRKIAVEFACPDSTNKPWHRQKLRLEENGAAENQQGPGGLNQGGGAREGPQIHRKPTETQASCTGVPQDGDTDGANRAHAALRKGVQRRRRVTQGVVRRRKECWGLELHNA
ncbi:hypothetical protein NDU88_011562 [Pleurodeles waltl]|uniref:Uncharacterized protein n=1 Tax=Pleurodeles waltl TaxID=8319 RepID=A0AAV7S585_PLEWA|nr:hypothetical protein NDU88_011562 [Pleurodeles waltl]